MSRLIGFLPPGNEGLAKLPVTYVHYIDIKSQSGKSIYTDQGVDCPLCLLLGESKKVKRKKDE